MPDTSEPRATLPFPSGTDAAAEAAPRDPLAGDWAEGLRGPVREVALKRPTRLRGQSGPTPRPLAALPPEQRTEQADLRILGVMSEALRTELPGPPPAEEEVEAPDAWASTDDQLASVPPPARSPAEVAPPAAEAPATAAPAAKPVEQPAAGALPIAAAPGHDTDETLPPLTLAQLEGPPPAAAVEPVADEVMLLSDAELADDEPPGDQTPIAAALAAPVDGAALSPPVAEPLAQTPEATSTAAAVDAPAAEAPAAEAPAAPTRPEPLALAGPVEPLALQAAPEELALPAAAVPLAPGAPSEALGAAPAEGTPPLAEAPALPSEDAPPLGFRLPGLAAGPAPEAAAPDSGPPAADEQAGAAVDPLVAASLAAPVDLASSLASDLDVALAPANATTGESAPLPAPGPDAQVPAEGMRAVFAAPAVTASKGWAAPEAAPHVTSETSETALDVRPVHRDAGPDATVHEGAPIALPPEQPVARANPPLPDDDLENTVLSLALAARQEPEEEVVEQLPEDAIAEPLPEDAIAGTADPAAPWNHAEIEVTPHGAAPAPQTPWDTAAAPEWHAEAAAGEWAGSAAQPAAPWAAGAAPSESWGAPAAPAANTDGWGDAPAAAAPDAWGATAAPAARPAEPWGAPAPAQAAVVSEWAQEAAGAFSADKLVSSPGASDWVIEAAPPPAATAWETGKPAGNWDVPGAAGAAGATGEWEAKTQAAFPVAAAMPGAHSGSPFAPLPPGASLSDDEPLGAGHADLVSLDDPDLPVPIYEPEPALPSSHLAVAGEHRVAVHTRAGRTRRGVVKDVDLAGTGFSLQPQSGAGVPESVQAAEVKAIFFMLPPGEKPAPGSGARVRVTFEDGRTIEGQRDGGDAPEGFFLVPGDAARTNTRRIFVARAAVQDLREG